MADRQVQMPQALAYHEAPHPGAAQAPQVQQAPQVPQVHLALQAPQAPQVPQAPQAHVTAQAGNAPEAAQAPQAPQVPQDATHGGELEVNILCLMSVVCLDELIRIPVTMCFSMF